MIDPQPPTAVEPAGTRAGLGSRYRRLVLATGASALGDGLVLVAFPLLAVTLTSSPVLIAGVAIAGQLPWLLVSLPAGAVADRVDRRRLLSAVELARAVVVLALALAVMMGHDSLPAVYLAAFLIGTLETAFSAAIKATLPALVDVRLLARANGYLYATETTGEQFLGPALGGVAFAWAPAVPFFGDALSFIISALLLPSALPRPAASAGPPPGRLLAEVGLGLKWFVANPLLRLLAVVVAGFAFCQAAVMSVLVLYGTHILHLGKGGYGLFLAAGAAGNVIGGVIVGPIHARTGPGRAVIVAGLTAAAGYLLLGFTSFRVVAVLGLAFESLAVAIGNVATLSLRQALIPANLLGRVNNAFRTCVCCAMPLGALAGGLMAAHVGLHRTFVFAGLFQVAAVVLTGRRLARRIAG